MRRSAWLANAATVAVSIVLTLLLLEGILRLLPIAWAPPVQPPTPDHPIQRYVANTPYTWSIGWNLSSVVRGRSNGQGFLANYDYQQRANTPLLAVLGDSFVEATWVPYADTLPGRLQALAGERGRVYAFAQSGSPLSQYVAYASHACALYRPERMAVVVVGNDFDESVHAKRIRNGIHHLHPRQDAGFDCALTPLPPPGLAERILRRSALALYLVRNVGLTHALERLGITRARAQGIPDYVGNTRSSAGAERVAEGERVIAWFLDALPRAACLDPERIALVVDGIRPQLYDEAALAGTEQTYFGRMRRALIEGASARGFRVVDMQPRFKASFAADGRRFEFANDYHWNPHAHALAAAAVAATFADWGPFEGRIQPK